MRIVDLRSDTVTVPTEEMREAMYRAEVGDDVYGEDPTVNRLEELAAEKVGKEAAVFLPSGTMANQVALLSHTNRGQEIILESSSHIFMYEVGGLAFLSGLQAKIIEGKNGIMNPADIRKAIRGDNIHFPETGLIALENTHNLAGGVVVPLKIMCEIYEIATIYKIPVHLDGARIFNAAVYLNCDVRELTAYCDSVMFCLSKGLGAPAGSMLAGNKKFIDKARKYRKMLGGGMRQVGILAAAGEIALKKMVERLNEDHENARLLAEGLGNIRGFRVDEKTVQTNIVMINIEDTGLVADEMLSRMKERGVLANKRTNDIIRLVTHKDVTRPDIEYAVQALKSCI